MEVIVVYKTTDAPQRAVWASSYNYALWLTRKYYIYHMFNQQICKFSNWIWALNRLDARAVNRNWLKLVWGVVYCSPWQNLQCNSAWWKQQDIEPGQWMFLVPLQCGSWCRCRCRGSGSRWWTAMNCGSCSVIVSAGPCLTLCRRLTSLPGNVFTSTTSSRWREPSLRRCTVSSSVGPSTVPGARVWHQWCQGTINIAGRSMLCIVDGPHHSTTCIDAVYCRWPCTVVCRSVCLLVCQDRQPCKNGWIDWDAVWDVDSGGSGESYIRCGVYWLHLANMTEPSMCGDDAALCQITLTTC